MCLVLGSVAMAQQRVPARSYGSRSGYRSALFPGTGGAPALRARGFPTTHAQRLGKVVGGIHAPSLGRSSLGRAAVYPIAVPVYYGGFGYGYGYQPPVQQVVQPPPQVTVVNQPPASPPVIINNYYNQPSDKPAVQEYTAGDESSNGSGAMKSFHAPVSPRPERSIEDDKPTVYLIAFKDQSIYPALGYWVEGDTLHYISKQGSHNRASVDLIDKAFSEQLNLERGLEFELLIAE